MCRVILSHKLALSPSQTRSKKTTNTQRASDSRETAQRWRNESAQVEPLMPVIRGRQAEGAGVDAGTEDKQHQPHPSLSRGALL